MEVEKIVVGPLQNNTYIVSKENECVVIDPSYEYSRIIGFIKEKNLTVKAVLITHAHFDHVTSLKELVEYTGAPVYMHKDDYGLYESSVIRLGTDRINIDRLLEGGETLNIMGEPIKVLHFPGHAKGCLCYIIGNNMFTGDFIFKGAIGRTDLQTSSPKDMIKSLKRFVELNGDYNIFCGHGEDTSFYEELNSNPFLLDIINGR